MRISLRIAIIGLSLLFISCSTKVIDKDKTISRAEKQKVNKKYKFVALVIGNKDYIDDNLENSINDAKKIANFLKQKGFAVIYVENVRNKQKFAELVNYFTNITSKNGVGLFYFSGHGASAYNQNYLIPIVNSNIYTNRDLNNIGYKVNDLFKALENKDNYLSIVMLDNCRNTLNKGSSKISSSGFLNTETFGVYTAYSTKEGGRARDNGLFAESFIKHAQTPGLNIDGIFQRVRKDIFDVTKGRQIPFSTTGIMGDFYFTEKKEKSSNNLDFMDGVFLTILGIATGILKI